MEFIKKFIERLKGKGEYKRTILNFVSSGCLNPEQEKKLDEIIEKYGLRSKDTFQTRKMASATAFQHMTNDKVITDEEKKQFENMIKYLGLEIKDSGFDQQKFNKYYMLGLIEKGQLPEVPIIDLNVIMGEGEHTHWSCPALLRKRKNIIKSYSYSGPAASIRIVKGFRYRIGEVKVQRHTVEVMAIEDTGNFWLSNKRIGFHGKKKSFAIEYKKIHNLEATGDGLVLFKQGRETPFIISLDDYDVPLAILSALMNKKGSEEIIVEA